MLNVFDFEYEMYPCSDIYLHFAGPGQDRRGAGGLQAIGQSLGRGRGGGDRTEGRGIEEEEP